MYEGIFHDVRKVKNNLKEVGISDIDESRIFDLLEDLKNPKIVCQVLIESKELNDPESRGRIPGPSAFTASSDFIDDDHNESDVEVIKEVRKEDKIRTVDLTDTADENFIPDHVFIKKQEPQDLGDGWSAPVEENSNEDSSPDETTNQNDCSNDSDLENYYTTSDYEDPDTDKKETDKSKSESPPPILSILKDLCENPKIPEQPSKCNIFEESIEMESSEILEENNNDPNNNHDLEEIQMVEPPRPRSPVAGCSRDVEEREPRRKSQPIDGENSNTSQNELILSPSAMNSFFSQENVDPKPSCSKQYNEIVPQSPTENGDEIEELNPRKSSQTNYEQLLKETQAISRLFPDTSGDVIFSMLDKYKKASNRVTVVLWDLMPRERPEPNFSMKRKRNNDPSPTNRERKKISPSGASSKIYCNSIKTIPKEMERSEKRATSEHDIYSSSSDEFSSDQSFSDLNNSELNNYDLNNSDLNNSDSNSFHLKSSDLTVKMIKNNEYKDSKSKSLPRSCVIQAPKFHFHSKSFPKNESRPVQKRAILTPPKLIINSQENKSNFQQVIAKPAKRKLTSPTRELTEEGFVIEGTESANADPNVPVTHVLKKVVPVKLQPFSKVSELTNFKVLAETVKDKTQYTVEQEDALRIKIKKSLYSENVDQPPVIKVRSDLTRSKQTIKNPASVLEGQVRVFPHSSDTARENRLPPVSQQEIPLSTNSLRKASSSPILTGNLPPFSADRCLYAPKPVSGFQKYDPAPAPVVNFATENRAELEKFLNKYLPNDELEKPAQLDFLNPHRQHQFHQMPRITRPPSFVPAPIISQKDPGPSNSSGNPVSINENTPVITAGPSSANPGIKKENENTEIPCKNTYYRLRGIFPDIDPEFIKEKCVNPPFNVNGLNAEQQMNMLVEILLTEGNDHFQVPIIKEELGNMVVDKDEQYENLLSIFPQADPTYLRDFVEKNHHIPDNLKDFVARNLEHPNYPTREDYLKKVKITEQIKQYTTEFNIKKFLQIFPDPVTHFENPSRRSEYNAVVYEFLKEIFCKYKVVTISHVYRKRKHHLSLTANDLKLMPPDMKNKRNSSVIPTENIPLLQEMAYVRHKNEIVAYLEEGKRKEEIEFEELREKGMLLECQCCFSDECMPSKCATCEKGHLFCHPCVLRGTETKMGDGQNHITCFTSCDSEFSLSVLQEVLPPTTFSILLQKRQEAEVMAAGLEGLVSCPFCHFASIPPPESKVFKCLNPECMRETCPLCKELNHVPLKCDEVMKSDQARRHLEEKMTEALVRTCYQCQKQFFKEEGCNKMTCVCGASMCYLCSTPLKQGVYSHFNGQGAQSAKLCPLWSDNRRLNAEVVRKVAEVTENEIKKMNPNLKLNAQALLPVLPPKTRGPHDDIPNANQLPEHVRRVAHINP